MAKVTKTQVTIRVMNENADKPMAVVVGLIAKANGVSEAVAKGAYRWCVKKGVAAGVVESGRSAPTAKAARKSKEVPAPKLMKEVGLSPATKKKLVTAKSDEEIAAIKAGNLARMKEVSAKQKKYNQIARPDGPGVKDFDADAARAEVAEFVEHGDDSFSVPRFLSKDQVKALV